MNVPTHIKDIMTVLNDMVKAAIENGFPQDQARKVTKLFITEVFDPEEYWDKELITV